MPRKAFTPKGDPPTADYVTALWRTKQNDGDEQRLRLMARNFRILTRLEHAIDIPTEYKATTKEVRTPFIRDAWERITASLTHNDWLPHFEPNGDSDKAKRASGIGERWVKGATQRMNRDVGEDTEYEACRAMVRDIESVIKIVHRPEAWATFPRRGKDDPTEYQKKAEAYKKGAPLPFAWRCVDRLQLLFEDGEFGDSWAVEYGEYPRPLMARQYGMRMSPESGHLVPGAAGPQGMDRAESPVTPDEVLGGKPTPEGELHSSTGMCIKMEYFDTDGWWHVVIDGSAAPGFPKPSPYEGRLPYARAKPSAEPESVLFSLMYLVPGLDAILTGMTNWMWLGMFPNPLLQDVPNSQAIPGSMMPPTGNDNQGSTFTWRPGKMLEVPRGKAFAFMQAPPVGQDAVRMVETLRSLIDIAGIPGVFRGLNGSGDSGYLANQMMGAVEMMYKRLARARERQLEDAVEFITYLVPAVVRQTVYVMGQGEQNTWLGLRDKGETTDTMASVDQLGSFRAEVRPDQAVMQQARMMIAKQALEGPPQSRLMSQRRALEFIGEEDPENVQDEIWLDETMATDPTINKIVVDNALRESKIQAIPPKNPAAELVGPDGMTPLIPGGIPGQVSGGLPDPGQALAMPQPGGMAGAAPGRPAGMFPGQPPQPPQQV